MEFDIFNNSLVKEDKVYVLSLKDTKIGFAIHTPIKSTVTVKVLGLPVNHILPAVYSYSSDDGNVFECPISFTAIQLDYLRNNTNTVLELKVFVNNSEVEGSIKLSIPLHIVESLSKLPSTYYSLMKEVSDIKAEINSIKFDYPTFNKSDSNVKKGMTPVATGFENEYVWDYPLEDVRNKIKDLATVVKSITEQITDISKKLSEIEEKLLDHIYEQFNL